MPVTHHLLLIFLAAGVINRVLSRRRIRKTDEPKTAPTEE